MVLSWEKKVFPTNLSNFNAYFNAYNDVIQEALLDFLKKAIMDYKENPMDDYAISTISAIVDILEPHFISDLVTEEPVVGWKKALRFDCAPMKECLVKLEIPAGAKIVRHLFGNKCRTNKAKVLDITNFDGTERLSHAYSLFDRNFKYTVGDIVAPQHNGFDERPWISCSEGIHFFETKEEAIEYDFS